MPVFSTTPETPTELYTFPVYPPLSSILRLPRLPRLCLDIIIVKKKEGEKGLDLVNVDFFVVAAAVAVFVELDVVVDAFAAVAVGGKELGLVTGVFFC